MKKFILALLAAGSVATANAQQDHSILLYGDVGFNTQTDAAKNNTMQWNVTPGVGYQFNNNWVVGINLGWNANSSKDSGIADRATVNDYTAGAFLRYVRYFGNSNFFWLGQLNLGYAGTYTTMGDAPSSDKASGFYANVVPAVGLMLGHGYAINFAMGGLGFTSTKADGASNSATAFNFNFGQEMTFGISKNFGCHHAHGHHEMGEDTHHIDTTDDSSDDSGDNSSKSHHKHHHKKSDDTNNDE